MPHLSDETHFLTSVTVICLVQTDIYLQGRYGYMQFLWHLNSPSHKTVIGFLQLVTHRCDATPHSVLHSASLAAVGA